MLRALLDRIRRALQPEARWIRLRFASVCRECGGALPEGATAMWAKRRGVFCARCWHGPPKCPSCLSGQLDSSGHCSNGCFAPKSQPTWREP